MTPGHGRTSSPRRRRTAWRRAGRADAIVAIGSATTQRRPMARRRRRIALDDHRLEEAEVEHAGAVVAPLGRGEAVEAAPQEPAGDLVAAGVLGEVEPVVDGSTAAASWLNMPSNGRTVPSPAPPTGHSHTWPSRFSSHDNHVPHGVGPPAQLCRSEGCGRRRPPRRRDRSGARRRHRARLVVRGVHPATVGLREHRATVGVACQT